MNPTWPAHARLHEVWLLGAGALIGLVALYFIWTHRPDQLFAYGLAMVLMMCLAGGFFIAAATAESYGGVLVDPLTAPQMPMNDVIAGIPLNLVAFAVSWILATIGWALARKAN